MALGPRIHQNSVGELGDRVEHRHLIQRRTPPVVPSLQTVIGISELDDADSRTESLCPNPRRIGCAADQQRRRPNLPHGR
jgi:hypothetical protein